MEREGSGVAASETRDVDSFTDISLSAGADVVVTIGEKQTLTVRGDDNLLDDLKTTVDDGRLEIEEDRNLDSKVGLTVEITVPDVAAVEMSGSGSIKVEGLETDLFRAEVSGAGDIEATGAVDRVEAEISGAGDVELDGLAAREAEAEISGAGDIHLQATDSLDASVSGSGSIVYTGDPENVQTEVSGAGAITAG
jgi:hypothetical protein